MNIFILEDDILQQQKLKRLLDQFVADLKATKVQIKTSDRPQRLLAQMATAPINNLYFLDITIGAQKKAGLELAEQIRQLDPYGTISFVTTYSEFLPLTYDYKVAALHFIPKDDPQKYHDQVLDSLKTALAHQQLPLAEDTFSLKNNYTNLQVPYEEILYFETTGLNHKVNLVMRHKRCEFFGSLKAIAAMDPRLFRCHQSFVINLANVTALDHHERLVYFGADTYCLVARNKIRELQQRLGALHG